MMIGKPNDVGAPQSPQRSNAPAAAAGRATPVVPGAPVASGDERVEGTEAADTVQLSDTSRTLIAGGAGGDEFRADKVAALKKAIEEGTYHAKAQKIAEELIREASELLESLTASK